jgi:antitoxin component YwqK of YwqJK toxin-antitoxin module
LKNPLSVAGVYFNRYEAEMAKGLLDEAGITSFISADDCGGMRPDIALGMGNFRVMVHRQDLSRAMDILVPLKKDSGESPVNSANQRLGGYMKGLIAVFGCLIVLSGFFFWRSRLADQLKENCQTLSDKPRYMEVCREFYKNGTIYSETYYEDRQNQGPVTVYFPDGSVKWVGTYDKGLLEGHAYEYFPNGKIRFELHYYKDELKGTIVEYFETGVIKSTLPYLKNQLEGAVKTYYPDGSLADESVYKNGRLLDKDGRYFSGEKEWSYQNGRPWLQRHFNNGLLQGAFKEFDENGRHLIESFYKNNQLDGISKEFYPNGRLKSESEYQNDFLRRMREYDPNGRLILDKTYSDVEWQTKI